MPTPPKDSDDTEHAIEEAKPQEVEKEYSSSDSTPREETQANPPIVSEEAVDPSVVKADPLKSEKEIAAEEVFSRETVSRQSEIPPSADTNIDSSHAEAVQNVSATIVPSIKFTYNSPPKIKDEPKQSTGASELSVKVEQKIEGEQNVEKSPQKPEGEVCDKTIEPQKTDQLKSSEETAVEEVKLPSEVSAKVEQKLEVEQKVEKSPQKSEGEVSDKTIEPQKTDQLKSPEEAAVDEVKLSSEMKTHESESCKSELSTESDKNIESSNTETVLQEKTAPIVEVTKLGDDSSRKNEDLSKESSKVFDVPGKVEEKEISASGNQKVEPSQQVAGKPRSEAGICKQEPGELKSSVGVPQSLTTNLPDSAQASSSNVKVGLQTPVPDHKPVSTKTADDSTQPNIISQGLLFKLEKTVHLKKLSEEFRSKMSKFEPYSHYYSRNKTCINIAKPDFSYAATRLKPTVVVKQGKFQVSLDISKFDFGNVEFTIEDDKIRVCGNQENENEFGHEYYQIQQIFKIPKHVNKSDFTACITDNYRLFIEAPIQIPSKEASGYSSK